MADWNPSLYTRFEDERTRPARDLLARCTFDERPAETLRIADLGCGPGNSTELLVERFPGAAITGFDTSDSMLEAARARLPGCRFERGDIAAFSPAEPLDVIFSNAALQWVPDHERLIPALFAHVAPGGLLAAQVPDNFAEPSHAAMRDIAAEPEFATVLAGMDMRVPVEPWTRYYDWLVPGSQSVDIWTTIYNHPMDGPQAITDWLSSTGLKRFVDRMPADLGARFAARHAQEMDERYPRRADGKRVLSFPRLFMVARKA